MKSAQIYTVLVLMLTLTACGGTKRQQFAQVNDSFIALAELVHASHDAGKITEDKWNKTTAPLLRLGDALLDQYDVATQFGGKPDIKTIDKLSDVVRQLNKQLE